MSLPLYYFLSITAIYILMSWCHYLPYRVAHLHFLTIANMLISGYLAGFLVQTLDMPFALALLAGFIAGGPGGISDQPFHRRRPHLHRGDCGLHLHIHKPHRWWRT